MIKTFGMVAFSMKKWVKKVIKMMEMEVNDGNDREIENPWGMVNFMSHCNKIYQSMEKRCEFLEVNFKETACDEDDFVWKTISDDDNFDLHLRMKIATNPNIDLNKRLISNLYFERIQYVFKDNYSKYKSILDLEGFAGIQDRTKIDYNFVFDKIKNKEVLKPDGYINNSYICSVLDKFDSTSKVARKIFDNGKEVEWKVFYSMLRTLYKKFFGEVVENKTFVIRDDDKTIRIPHSVFNLERINKHKDFIYISNNFL